LTLTCSVGTIAICKRQKKRKSKRKVAGALRKSAAITELTGNVFDKVDN
jgi:hypothetical protein